MDKVKFSNRINRLGCGHELLYCTRVYVNARLSGGTWIPMEWFLNKAFFLARGEKDHVRASYLWEMRYGKEETKARFQTEGEEQMSGSEEWEFSFLPLDEGGIHPDGVPCDQCGERRSLLDMTEVKKQGTVEPINLRFCNENCANDWHMNFIRRNET